MSRLWERITGSELLPMFQVGFWEKAEVVGLLLLGETVLFMGWTMSPSKKMGDGPPLPWPLELPAIIPEDEEPEDISEEGVEAREDVAPPDEEDGAKPDWNML